MKNKIKYICFLLLVCVISPLLLCGCGKLRELELKSPLSEEERIYYTDEAFDTFVQNENGEFSKIPHIYVVYSDGTRSADVSHSPNISYSGYDLKKPGEQAVTVTYTEDGEEITATYKIYVEQTEPDRLEADDNIHYTAGCFYVGDKFTTYSEESGTPRGVTLTVYYNHTDKSPKLYFTNDENVKGAVFDTSACELDQNGCFTKAGVFEIKVNYMGLNTSYKITVCERG